MQVLNFFYRIYPNNYAQKHILSLIIKTAILRLQVSLHIIVLCILFSKSVLGQVSVDENRINISGVIYDEKSSDRIPFVHIIDITRNRGTNADDNGNFSLNTFRGDSLKFTAIGYSDCYVYLADTLMNHAYIVVNLTPKSYLLEGLDYYANDPMKGFYLKDIERDTIRIGGSKGMPGAAYWNGTPSAGGGYVTAFANLFNNHAKQEKKLAKILEEKTARQQQEFLAKKEERTVEDKYSRELVHFITDLVGPDLDYFISVYKPSKMFILRSTEYEIALQIVESYRDYQYENGFEVDIEEILRRAKFKD